MAVDDLDDDRVSRVRWLKQLLTGDTPGAD